jgi:hypothetical protein
MTPKAASNQIRELLDALPKKKTNKEKLFLVFKIKVLVEIIEEPLKRKREEEARSAAQRPILKKALRQLLTALDRIYAKHEEVGDTDVREQIYAAIHKSFIKPRRDYLLPNKLGMFSGTGDDLVRAAIHKFLTHPEVAAASRSLKSPEDRFAAFQDGDIETSEGTSYFDYFGHSNKPRVS